MANMQKVCACCVLVLAGFSVGAMPVGVRMAMLGRASMLAAASGNEFPELDSQATPASVADALSGATDEALSANITDAATYSEFRTWAASVGSANVKTSNTAWMSYALGVPNLVPIPQEGDLVIDDAVVGEGGNIEAVFSLDGVYVNQAALEARLKTVFGVEGANSLDMTKFSSDNIVLVLEPTGDGRVRATVTPPPGTEDAYFMKVKVK